MSALGTPVQDDLQPQTQDHQLQIQQQQLADGLQQQQLHNGDGQGQVSESGRKREFLYALLRHPATPSNPARKTAKAPSVRRACAACHAGKTRCSESLPCQASLVVGRSSPVVASPLVVTQSCIKRGLTATCAYPDPDAESNSQTPSACMLFYVDSPWLRSSHVHITQPKYHLHHLK